MFIWQSRRFKPGKTVLVFVGYTVSTVNPPLFLFLSICGPARRYCRALLKLTFMDSKNLILFTEELLPLMRKYGYRGIVGFVMGADVKPACFDLTVAGEPKWFYQGMREHLVEVLVAMTGKPPVERGEVNFVPKKSDDAEMPF